MVKAASSCRVDGPAASPRWKRKRKETVRGEFTDCQHLAQTDETVVDYIG